MYNVYQLFMMNKKELPFKIKRVTWGNLSITVDKIDNIRFSAKNWYCDAYTKSKEYKDIGYGEKNGLKLIGNCGSYQWLFFEEDKEYDGSLLPKIKQLHTRGLKYQKAGKDYSCYFCKKIIYKGEEYERYSMQSAGINYMRINEVFCLGHRDKMREEYFNRRIGEIKFKDLMEVWDKGIII